MRDILLGKTLYLKQGDGLVGKVVNSEPNHKFDDGKIGDGVKIMFANGAIFWIPKSAVDLLYVTR